MRHRIAFLRYFAQARYAEALAQLDADTWPHSNRALWACYRLGLHATVAQARWNGTHLRSGMAIAASLAACGRAGEATSLVQRLVARHGAGHYQAELAEALAPFMPDLALSLVKHAHAQPVLQTALLLRMGERDHAVQRLQTALASQKPLSPELHLLATNALGGTPAQALARINAFLAQFSLPALALQDASRPPGVGNLISAAALPVSQGPRVSVLMTAYNIAGRIGAAIQGLLDQTWQNVEVVVVDDASTDNTADVVLSWAARDARVKYLRLPQNGGTYVAKTFGLQHATGEFVTCHDADDWSHPLRLERQVRPLLDNPRLVASLSYWVRMEDDGTFYARSVYPLMRLNPASPLFRRREVEQQAGLWHAVRTGADSEFQARLRLVFGRQALYRLAQPLAFGAHRENSLMTAADTGYNPQGMSPARLAYWEAWTRWQIGELHAGRKPVMPSIESQVRLFAAHPGMAVHAPGATLAIRTHAPFNRTTATQVARNMDER